jgi:membrane protein YqaA with SNARE-associated domain
VEYLTLFITSLIAGSLIPMSSEAVVIYLLSLPTLLWLVFLTATAGNTIGSCINYLLGGKGARWALKKRWIKADRIRRGKAYFDRWGAPALLLSWMPVIGTPITLAAGALGYPPGRFVAIVALAKAVRYGLLIAGFYAVI